ncbi:MAG: MotA/TolQ/ExbB proton channel family protein [Ignavibacteria bacterium]|jgi:biopolymer transport protein ExbB|nr:MotA/TolQ/ExbB proton channel family protein [Ignavibacteria bacterium]MBK7157236.1 MotA/TolQ/ExbB proton channel family protein [Ignavibacteria bacterium]MBK7256177.1 MotA/TolQ/ExbB proton channel family protein [Ignavibacteria bacterium]MBK7444601.1 MotA/TolQ/ExbB proton channel family protein [Ignavibacteria bacterium]MBK9403589.1 MotA/TolQ/ExbB proton channel family protein [Ignavibacteria bacterium]
MKQSIFMTVVIVVALIVSALIFYGVFGNINNFKTPEKNTPANIMGAIYLGGPIVVLLMALSIMVITFTIERQLSLSKAKGRGPIEPFLKKVQSSLLEGNIDDAIAECDKQRGSIANILRQGLDKYQSLAGNNKIEAEQKLQEVQSAIEEAMMLEVPLLEKNLVVLSTIASVSVLIGLFGTVVGMIRSFQALATAGTPNAAELSSGISEALINTAGGLFGAIVGTISYNYFVTKVGNITYMIDEATYNMLQILTLKGNKKSA